MTDLGAIAKTSLPAKMAVNSASANTTTGKISLPSTMSANKTTPAPNSAHERSSRSGPQTQITGTITKNGIPTSRQVRIYDQQTGAICGMTTSNATTGEFTAHTAGSGAVDIVVLDDQFDAPVSNAQIRDNVIPT